MFKKSSERSQAAKCQFPDSLGVTVIFSWVESGWEETILAVAIAKVYWLPSLFHISLYINVYIVSLNPQKSLYIHFTDEGEGRGDHRQHTKGQNQRYIVTKQWN